MSVLTGTIMLDNINVTYHIERKSVKNIKIRDRISILFIGANDIYH